MSKNNITREVIGILELRNRKKKKLNLRVSDSQFNLIFYEVELVTRSMTPF